MHIRGKIFLQFFSSWTLMPIALLLAQVEGVAQLPEFINAILVITSIAPIQVYINEIFAPIAVRYGQRLGVKHALEIAVAIFALTGWLAYRLELDLLPSVLIMISAQAYIWFSYMASRRVLEYQADSVIGGRYSYIIGSIIPLIFLLLIVAYWLLFRVGLHYGYLLYLLILLPNCIQYIYTKYGWMAKERIPSRNFDNADQAHDYNLSFRLFLTAVLMAVIAQHWKIELSGAAVGFAALSIYIISPFSSMWLILSKSKFMTRGQVIPSDLNYWAPPCLSVSTLILNFKGIGWVFLLALVTQVLTFKFITDTRLKFASQILVK